MDDYKHTPAGRETARKYADLLDQQRPQSAQSLRKHPRMPLENRAKIFSPFAALRGYDDQLAEVRAEQLAPPPDREPFVEDP